MRAFVVTGPGESAVLEIDPPVPSVGQVVVDVERVGVCGTDVEFFTGEMAYLAEGSARYPMRLGHEWCGLVSEVGPGVDVGWLGRRVTGDTMLGCGHCRRCRSGRHWVCAERFEIGIRGGFAGALAEQLAVPAWALHALPDSVDPVAGAMVEPGGNALRAVRAAALLPGMRLLVLGPGTIGLLAALFGAAAGAEVHLLGLPGPAYDYAKSLEIAQVWTQNELPELSFDAVLDASNSSELPAYALSRIEPGRRIVLIGISGSPSPIDTRALVFHDAVAVGILGASQGLAGAIEHYAAGTVDPRRLVAATVPLSAVGAVLAGDRPAGAGAGPKIHVNPSMSD